MKIIIVAVATLASAASIAAAEAQPVNPPLNAEAARGFTDF